MRALDPDRVQIVQPGRFGPGPVLYWMCRDFRLHDNWALLHARAAARAAEVPLVVVVCLHEGFPGMAGRRGEFLLAGLKVLENDLRARNIPMFLLTGDPVWHLPEFVRWRGISSLVTDYSPLRRIRGDQIGVVDRLSIPVQRVDAHNIVPAWLVSGRPEYAARTIRPKLNRQLFRFLTPFPQLRDALRPWSGAVPRNDWSAAARLVRPGPPLVRTFSAGEAAGRAALRRFLTKGLPRYSTSNNDANAGAVSHLSPYLNCGQLSAQRVALAVQQVKGHPEAKATYLEQLVIRRELSDNYCEHNRWYDDFRGFPAWSRRSLEEHADDPRDHIYCYTDLVAGRSDDSLWNAAQHDLLHTGRMPGYLRMYWAKRLLTWTNDPAEALHNAIRLNDELALDGCDPNGYTGCAWSIGGVHDRPWFERPIFGKVRTLTAAGCRRQFDIPAYIERVASMSQQVAT
ncbi:MAG: deoxyribodipyrimidine photo-lyase [bacterium]